MSEEIGRLTELIARDPSNMAFLSLAELLRVRGDFDAAYKVAIRGLERHSLNAEAHALLARICIDRGELQRAFDEWDMALRLSPGHSGALKGMGFITYRWGRLDEAEGYLVQALESGGEDPSVLRALESVRAARATLAGFPGGSAARSEQQSASGTASREAAPASSQTVEKEPSVVGGGQETPVATIAARDVMRSIEPAVSARDLFHDSLAGTAVHAMLIDSEGLVIAGGFGGSGGQDRAQEAGAELSGVGDEASRAVRHLGLGEWRSITFEAEKAVVAIARAPENALVVLASDRNTPLGLLRRLMERVQQRARDWLEGGI